jgi:quercetin 2,3-dioxygenase
LLIKQDTTLSQLILEPNSSQTFPIKEGRHVDVHQVSSTISVNGAQLTVGDGAKIGNESKLKFSNNSNNNALTLVFDLPW